ncbi:MAG: DUF4160 domain-containing protein [Acidimicrobiales bacterium]
MPRISAFYGIVIAMYWQDHNPPHFHAFYSGDEALVRIADGVTMRGELPPAASRLVAEWADLRRDELLADWELAQIPTTLRPIEGLR